MDKDIRNLIFNTTQAIRRLLEEEFSLQLEGTFDVHPDGRIAEEGGPQLSAAERLIRKRIVQTIEHRRSVGESPLESVRGYQSEAVFTFLNRLAALKMMEARALVLPCVSQGDQSQGFKEFSGLAPGLIELPDKGYRLYLECIFDEIGREVGVLFDRTDAASQIWPRRKALESVLEKLNNPALATVWAEDETIGWIYQYYNDPEERRQMRDESAAPRNSRELAVRNQFFTPRYVVEFLTDNTLGRIWYEMTQGQTRLKEQCRYLVRRPDEVFLSRLASEDSETIRAARLLTEGTAETFPEFDQSEASQQCLRTLASCVNAYYRHALDGGHAEAFLDKMEVDVLKPGRFEGVSTQDLLDALFFIQRREKFTSSDYQDFAQQHIIATGNEIRRRVLRSREPNLTQEELLKQPVFIPFRPLKDPRAILMLDPACGSMHFGLYAFDLLERIYDEAWEMQADAGAFSIGGKLATWEDRSRLMEMLALANSRVFDFWIALFAGKVGGVQYESGLISRIPYPREADRSDLAALGRRGWAIKRRQDQTNLTSHAALLPALLAVHGETIASRLDNWIEIQNGAETDLSAVLREIDELVLRLYGLAEEDLLSPSAFSQGIVDDDDYELEFVTDSEEGLQTTSTTSLALTSSFIDYLTGSAYGHWDVLNATGQKLEGKLPEPFAQFPICSPGQLQNAQGLPSGPKDITSDYPICIPWDGILVDDPNHPLDVIERVREVLRIIWKERAEAIEEEACEILGVKSLRDYFRKPGAFFADHLKRYSKSRRQAPIYWSLSSPNGLYTVWLYYHRLTADILFTVLRDHVKPKLEYEERRAFQMRQEAGVAPTPSQRQDLAEAEELVEDLRAFKSELERVAPLFNPNLNDGVIINYAPLWRMIGLPKWRKDCLAIWNELANGDYDWAHLAFHLWPERVIPKCATDRSLAIAHGLEETFWQEDPAKAGKWIARKVPAAQVEKLIAERTSPAVKAALEKLVEASDSSTSGRKSKRTKK